MSQLLTVREAVLITAVVLAAITVGQSKGKSLLAWAVLAIGLVLAW